MTYGSFLSTVAVVAILASVALLAVLSALTLAALDRFRGRFAVAFVVCMVAIWAGAVSPSSLSGARYDPLKLEAKF
jgi:uncharacterized membrane protein